MQDERVFIKMPSKCTFIKNKTYTVHCPQADIVQPEVSASHQSWHDSSYCCYSHGDTDTGAAGFQKDDQITTQHFRSSCPPALKVQM